MRTCEAANYRHATACDKASECVFFVEGEGKFDIKVVEEGKAPAKTQEKLYQIVSI